MSLQTEAIATYCERNGHEPSGDSATRGAPYCLNCGLHLATITSEPPVTPSPTVTAEGWGAGNAPDGPQTKQCNPKDIIGSRKIDLGLVPDTLVVCAANALLEGALKYGRYNWRIAGVSASVYHAAARRHEAKWWNGQDFDALSNVHHLDNAIACLAIIRDAMLYDKLTDDRPPCPDPDAMADLIDESEMNVAHLKATFGEHKPYQFTIADTPHDETASATETI